MLVACRLLFLPPASAPHVTPPRLSNSFFTALRQSKRCSLPQASDDFGSAVPCAAVTAAQAVFCCRGSGLSMLPRRTTDSAAARDTAVGERGDIQSCHEATGNCHASL
uniref:Secreted protein n=1 Tax=Chlamydomonas euryale TaxID=1486919 RepID=A0A7R9VF29_9CHLO